MNFLAPKRNALVLIELDNKRKYKFLNGTEIEIVKGFDFNLRQDNPSVCKVVNAENIPKDSIALIHHNSVHDTYKVFDFEDEEGNAVENLFSIPMDMIYFYSEDGENWKALPDFLITKRIYKEYNGLIQGIEPEQVKQRLYVVNGSVDKKDLSGKAIMVTKHSDYQIMFHKDVRPISVIRTRCREYLAVDNGLTIEINKGKYLIGNDLQDAKKI